MNKISLKIFFLVIFLINVSGTLPNLSLYTQISGDQCCSNPPNLNSSSEANLGLVEDIGGLKAYVTGSYNSKLAIILISDVYGYEAPKLRKVADKVAEAGFHVLVPDFFHGEPYDPNNAEKPKTVWMKSHGTDKGFEEAKPVVAALKDKGFSSVGAAGFCWGGKVVMELAKSECYIQAAVLLHPSNVTVDDIKEVETPIAVLGAEFDHLTSPALLEQFKQVLSAKPEIDSFVKVFPGVSHGWTIRYKDEDEKEVKSALEAQQNMLDWFVQHIK